MDKTDTAIAIVLTIAFLFVVITLIGAFVDERAVEKITRDGVVVGEWTERVLFSTVRSCYVDIPEGRVNIDYCKYIVGEKVTITVHPNDVMKK